MNAPTPPDAVAVASLRLAEIAPSPTNPRKHFDAAYLAELAATIKQHGVIQPITVRPISVDGLLAYNKTRKPDADMPRYEIVVGECRYRSAALAGLTDIPAFWRELDDKQVLEIQVIENLQRRDVHPLEEAVGYDQLMKKHAYQVEQIADKIGKSVAYIYARIKLLACGRKAMDAFYAGELDASRALLIARIPTQLQDKALKEILEGGYRSDGPMSYRAAKEHVQEEYMLALNKAPFPRDAIDLVPKCGACGPCPKRTGNQRDLFSDVKSADVCTDPPCYQAKATAHAEKQRAAAKAAGQKIITGKEAEKIAPYGIGHNLTSGFVNLDEKNYSDSKARTWREILGKKDAPAPILLVDPKDKTKHAEVLPRSTIAEHLKSKGIELSGDVQRKLKIKTPAEKLAAKREKLKGIYHGKLFDAVRSGLTVAFDNPERTLLPDELAIVARCLYGAIPHSMRERIAVLWYGEPKNGDRWALIHEFSARIPNMSMAVVSRLMLECTLVIESLSIGEPEDMLAVAKNVAVDAKAIELEVFAELKAKEKPKPPAKKATKKPAPATVKTDPDAPPAAQAHGKGAPEKTTAPAAPAEAKPKSKSKAKAKDTPAPATPSKEPAKTADAPAGVSAAPVKTGRLTPAEAWPFPAGNRPTTKGV